MAEKQYNADSIRLSANEALLSAKGFLIFTINPDGSLSHMGSLGGLNAAEAYGLNAYAADQLMYANDEDYNPESNA